MANKIVGAGTLFKGYVASGQAKIALFGECVDVLEGCGRLGLANRLKGVMDDYILGLDLAKKTARRIGIDDEGMGVDGLGDNQVFDETDLYKDLLDDLLENDLEFDYA